MSKQRHKITNVKDNYGDCAVCGRVPVETYGNKQNTLRCSVKRKELNRRAHFKRRYNIAIADVGTPTPCAICGSNKRISLDHDHLTEAIRGWLCGKCNSGLGFFQDKPEILKKAIEYLKKYGKV